MSPQKPTSRSPGRRVGLPKTSGLEPAHQAERPLRSELPTDFQSLALILEAAMNPGRPAQTPNSQLLTPKPQVASLESQESNQGTETDLPSSMPHRRRTDEPEGPPQPIARPGQASQQEAVAFDEVARSLAAAEACVPLLAQSTGLLRIA